MEHSPLATVLMVVPVVEVPMAEPKEPARLGRVKMAVPVVWRVAHPLVAVGQSLLVRQKSAQPEVLEA